MHGGLDEDQRGPVGPHCGPYRGHVDPGRAAGHRDQPGPHRTQHLDRATERRFLDQHRCTGLQQRGGDQAQRLLRAPGDDDLVRRGGQAQVGVVTGHGLPQGGQPGGQVTVCADQFAQVSPLSRSISAVTRSSPPSAALRRSMRPVGPVGLAARRRATAGTTGAGRRRGSAWPPARTRRSATPAAGENSFTPHSSKAAPTVLRLTFSVSARIRSTAGECWWHIRPRPGPAVAREAGVQRTLPRYPALQQPGQLATPMTAATGRESALAFPGAMQR